MPTSKRCGVYWIYNTVTGIPYVGSTSVNFSSRWNTHRVQLNAGRHPNSHLQNSWNVYGEKAFLFEVLEVICPDEAVSAEQRWLDLLLTYEPGVGYNMCKEARSVRGIKRSPETLQRMSEARRGKPHSEETKKRLSEISKNMSPETKKKMSDAAKIRKASDETKRKMSEANRGRKHTDECKARMSELAKSRTTPELRKARSEQAKNRPQEWIDNIRAKALARSAETSAFQRKRFEDPAERERMSLLVKAGKAAAKLRKQKEVINAEST